MKNNMYMYICYKCLCNIGNIIYINVCLLYGCLLINK